VLAWLARHPRWTFHFTPTSGSWLNAVESLFSALTRRRLRRGVFCSIVELQAAIDRYIDEHNDDPAPFVWTKTADQITAKLNRLNASVHQGRRGSGTMIARAVAVRLPVLDRVVLACARQQMAPSEE
jgi:hypothetical protein